jgi:hypothetical protein
MASLHRRAGDEEQDFTRLRGGGGPFNGHTKWVVTTVSAAIIAALGYLIVRDRVGVDTQIQRLDSTTLSLSLMTAQHEAQIQVLKAKQDRVLEDLRANGAKLDEVLKELRRR